ncbi:MAG: hypothetical protein V3V49_15280 [Candidatus Krumholzibacteria bacterium]
MVINKEIAIPVFVRFLRGSGLALLVLVLACPAGAQIGNQLSAYTGPNAIGFLQPLVDAFGADLNSGLYHSAARCRISSRDRIRSWYSPYKTAT